jgi:hypothetical protein
MYLKTLGETPVALTMAVKARVKKIKLMTSPMTVPIGLNLPFPPDTESKAGRTGITQGERTVAIPAKNENKMRTYIEIDRFF